MKKLAALFYETGQIAAIRRLARKVPGADEPALPLSRPCCLRAIGLTALCSQIRISTTAQYILRITQYIFGLQMASLFSSRQQFPLTLSRSGIRHPNAAMKSRYLILLSTLLAGCAKHSRQVPQTDTAVADEQGTMHVTRIIPMPQTISPEAQQYLLHPVSHPGPGATLAEVRAATDAMQAHDSAANRARYPVNIQSSAVAGVPVRIVTPIAPIPAAHADQVLICLHGGGFTTDSGSLTEAIPIAHLAQTKVVSVLYRLAPEHPFPAAVHDAVAVYKELLHTYKPSRIGIYGASAGAILTAEVAVKIKQLGLPLPGALGIFTGSGDFSKVGDSAAMYSVVGLWGPLHPPRRNAPWLMSYVGRTNPKDPVLSPLYSDLRGMPPTLFLTSTRDMLLSGTTILHRAFLRAGDDAQLVVFDGLPHGFWYEAGLPESQEADKLIGAFFDTHLAAPAKR